MAFVALPLDLQCTTDSASRVRGVVYSGLPKRVQISYLFMSK
jgi:hypothetical protein